MTPVSRFFALLTLLVTGFAVVQVPAFSMSPEALQHYQQAVAAEKSSQLEQAEYHLNQAITIDPTDPLNYLKLGNVLEAEGRFDRALLAYQKAAMYDAQDQTIYYSIGEIHEQMNQLPEARAAYETALRKNPDYRFGLFPLGRVLARQGDNQKAIAVYEEFLKAYPNHVKAKRYLAGLYYSQNQPARTMSLLNAVRNERPQAFSDYLLLAQAYNDLKQPQQALAILEEAKRSGLSMAALSQAAATAHEAMGDQAAAARELELSLAEDANDMETRLKLAQLYSSMKQPEQALGQINPYLDQQPASIPGRYLQANALLDLGRFAEATQSLEQLGRQLPATAPAADRFVVDKQLAFAYQQSGQPAKAAALYEQWKDRPQGQTDPELMRNLAIAYHQQGDLEKAVPIYRTLLQQTVSQPDQTEKLTLLKQDYTRALLTLANLQYQANQLGSAAQLFDEAVRQGDGSTASRESALLGVANVAFSNGELEKARQTYEQVLALNPEQPTAKLAVTRMQVDARTDLPSAILTLQKLTQQPEVAAEAWIALGDAYDKNGQGNQAIVAYEQARQLNPQQLSAWITLGEAYYSAKRMPEAEQAFNQVLTLDPGNVTALYNRASIRLAQQQLPAAETDFRAVLAAKPDLADAQYGLAVLYDRQKQSLKAAIAYDNYLLLQPSGSYAAQARTRLVTLKKSLPAYMSPVMQPISTTGPEPNPVTTDVVAEPPATSTSELQRIDP